MNKVSFPMTFCILGIFKPLYFLPRKTYSNVIYPSISINIHAPTVQRSTMPLVILKFLGRFNFMLGPVGSLKPMSTCHHVYQSILADISHCHSFGDEIA